MTDISMTETGPGNRWKGRTGPLNSRRFRRTGARTIWDSQDSISKTIIRRSYILLVGWIWTSPPDLAIQCRYGVKVMFRLLTTIAGFGAIVMLVACQGLQNLEPFLTPAADPTVEPTAELVQSDILKAPSTDIPGPTTSTRGSKGDPNQSRVTPSPLGKIGVQGNPLPTSDIKPVPPTVAAIPQRKADPVLATAIPQSKSKPVLATTTPRRRSVPAVATPTPPSRPERRTVPDPTPTRPAPTPNVQKGSQQVAEAILVAATIVSLNISADSSSINVSDTLQFTALGTYSDGAVEDVTASVSWKSTDQGVGSIGSIGNFTASAAGNTTIQASQDDVASNTLSLTVDTIDTATTATHLDFLVQPSATEAGDTITPAVQVEISDSNNNRVTDATTSITLVISRNTSSTLSGTTTVAAVDGVATFSDLSIDTVSIGYLLDASGEGLTDATSANFEIIT